MELKPGYKQTELGSLPEDWVAVELGEFLDFKNGLNKGKDYFGYGTPIVNYMDVYNNAGLKASDILGRVTVTKQELDAYSANRGDVFFTRTSETADEVGIASVLLEDIADTVFSGFVLRARPKKHLLSDDFKKYCFSSEVVRNQIVSKSTYTTRALTNGRTLASVLLPMPFDEQEQKAIAEALNDTDELIESLERLISKKRKIKQGAMQDLLSGRKRLSGFDGEWQVKMLGELFFISGGLPASRDQLGTAGYCYLHYGDIHTSRKAVVNIPLEFADLPKLDIPLGKVSTSSLLKDGDVVFVDASEDAEGSSKHVVIINPGNIPFISGLHTIVAKSKSNELDTLYRRYCFHTPEVREQFQFYVVGTKVSGISKRNIVKIKLRVPTQSEQIAIASVLAGMDAEIDSLKTKLVKARWIKQGILQELLTGRIRLVKPESNAVELRSKEKAATASRHGHNSAINEAVIISVLAKKFGSEQYPLGRKRYTKLSYLLHRHADGRVEGYLEKAAGPYNPSTKYKGAEKIALSNRYVRSHAHDNFSGFVAAEKIAEAENYFAKWYGDDAVNWLEQFRYKKNDELELLATVDMAMENLQKAGKQYLDDAPEWTAKLSRTIFADENIDMAIKWSRQLFEVS
jgi:type I restriction enzyme S subunit